MEETVLFSELELTIQHQIRRCIAWKLDQLPETCVYIQEDGKLRNPNQQDRKLLEDKKLDEWTKEFIKPIQERFPKIEDNDNESRIVVIVPLQDDPKRPGFTCFVKSLPKGVTVYYPVFGSMVRFLVQ